MSMRIVWYFGSGFFSDFFYNNLSLQNYKKIYWISSEIPTRSEKIKFGVKVIKSPTGIPRRRLIAMYIFMVSYFRIYEYIKGWPHVSIFKKKRKERIGEGNCWLRVSELNGYMIMFQWNVHVNWIRKLQCCWQVIWAWVSYLQ